jgi:hypothetical protein
LFTHQDFRDIKEMKIACTIKSGDRESHYLVTESPRRELALGFVNNARENRRTPIKPDEVKQLKKIVLQTREPNHDLRRRPSSTLRSRLVA